ncbi:hypothetical protein XaplCFBP3123_06540 [Xanthomonas arboricola pv. populi]|nr:hypothetical protein XaplCFBP3123_06540 [Xanthomonas arboricola pv. populi]
MGQRQQGQQHRKERCTPPRRAALAVLKPHGRCTLHASASVVRASRAGVSRLPWAAPILGRSKPTSGCSRVFL